MNLLKFSSIVVLYDQILATKLDFVVNGIETVPEKLSITVIMKNAFENLF